MSFEYGLTIDEISKMTMREVDWRLKKMAKRKNLQYKFEASLHGLELKIPETEIENKKIKVTPEQEISIQKAQQKSLERKRLKYGK